MGLHGRIRARPSATPRDAYEPGLRRCATRHVRVLPSMMRHKTRTSPAFGDAPRDTYEPCLGDAPRGSYDPAFGDAPRAHRRPPCPGSTAQRPGIARPASAEPDADDPDRRSHPATARALRRGQPLQPQLQEPRPIHAGRGGMREAGAVQGRKRCSNVRISISTRAWVEGFTACAFQRGGVGLRGREMMVQRADDLRGRPYTGFLVHRDLQTPHEKLGVGVADRRPPYPLQVADSRLTRCGAPIDDAVADGPLINGSVDSGSMTMLPADAAPVADAPVADAPVADAPMADAPVAEAPVVDALGVDAPVAEAPDNDGTVDDGPLAKRRPSASTCAPGVRPKASRNAASSRRGHPWVSAAWVRAISPPGVLHSGLAAPDRAHQPRRALVERARRGAGGLRFQIRGMGSPRRCERSATPTRRARHTRPASGVRPPRRNGKTEKNASPDTAGHGMGGAPQARGAARDRHIEEKRSSHCHSRSAATESGPGRWGKRPQAPLATIAHSIVSAGPRPPCRRRRRRGFPPAASRSGHAWRNRHRLWPARPPRPAARARKTGPAACSAADGPYRRMGTAPSRHPRMAGPAPMRPEARRRPWRHSRAPSGRSGRCRRVR